MAKSGKFASEHLALVSSYGLKWERNATEWPNLHAVRTNGRRVARANFRNQMGLYILYHGDKSQYVGIADRLGDRIAAHLHEQYEWDTYSWFGNKPLIEADQSRVTEEKEKEIGFAEIDSILVRPKRVWHDFEAVVFHAFGFEIAAKSAADSLRIRGQNRRVPVFGHDAEMWDQVKSDKPSNCRRESQKPN